jgi:OOP family OmpA-OmpF porin
MRCNWLRWLWGLVPLGLLIAFTFASTRDQIQADLKNRTETALRQAGLPWADTGFDGRDGRVIGEAYAETDQQRALDVVRDVWGVRVADDRSSLIEKADTYVWTAERRSDVLRLTGFVPSSAARKEIVDAAKATFPDKRVIDDMKPARGAPETPVWLGGIKFGLNQLARLEPGAQATLRNTEFEISGRALSTDSYRNVSGALRQSLPGGLRLAQARIDPAPVSPFPWAATYDGRRVVLEGYVPDEDARKQLVAAASEAFPNAAIVDRMGIAGGAPGGFVPAASAALATVKSLQTAKIAMSDTSMAISGLAEREETAIATREATQSSIPPAIRVTTDIGFVMPRIQTVSPYRTSVIINDDVVRVGGYVPSQQQRQSLIKVVTDQFPGKRIIDALQIANGQPEGWGSCLTSSLNALARVGNGTLSMRDDTMTMTGVTTDEALAKSLPGELRTATSRVCKTDVMLDFELPPEPELSWSARHDGKSVVLEGEVPNSDTKTALAERAAQLFPNAQIDDRMRVSPSPSTRWGEVALTSMQLMSRLRIGECRLEGTTLTVNGEARDTAAATGIRQRLKSGLPTGFTGADTIQVKSDAMIWAEQEARRREEEARRRQEEAQEARQRAAAEEARRKAEEARLTAERAERERRETERRWREAEARAAEEDRRRAEAARLAAAERAEAERRAAEAERARAADEARRRAAEAQARAERERAEAEERRERLEAARRDEVARLARLRCQQAIDEVSTTGQINFRTGSAEISRSSYGLLDNLAAAAKSCENVAIDIEGHTDSQGSEENNLTLSQRRAQSVVDYLVRAGVDTEQLTARGYGESRPLVDNSTAANRAQNRRIEFVVKRRGT